MVVFFTSVSEIRVDFMLVLARAELEELRSYRVLRKQKSLSVTGESVTQTLP